MIAQQQAVDSCGSHHCVTCGDDGDPMVVLSVNEDRGLALCAGSDGERRTVETELIGPVTAGDRVLVHAGVALVALP